VFSLYLCCGFQGLKSEVRASDECLGNFRQAKKPYRDKGQGLLPQLPVYLRFET